MRAIGDAAETNAPIDAVSESGSSVDHSEEFALNLDDAIVESSDYDLAEDASYSGAATDRAWIAPTLALLAVAAWTSFYAWAMQDTLLGAAAAPAATWPKLVVDWCIPVLLIGLVWMLAMRNSRVEASRFAKSAALLSQESRELESRLIVVNRELSLAREFLASQSRELESLGRIASERISTHAGELQSLIKENGDQVEAIGSASETALGNMSRLRDDLPVVANSARDVSNQIGNAGRTASEKLDALVAGFERLNAFGKASETQVAAFGGRVGSILETFETQIARIEETLGQRFEELSAQTASYRSAVTEGEEEALSAVKERIGLLQTETRAVSLQLHDAEQAATAQLSQAIDRVREEMSAMVQTVDGLDKQAVGAAQERIKELHIEAGRFDDTLAQRDARFLEEMERRQAAFETREAQATEVLAQRLAELDEALAERRDAQIAQTEKLVEHSRTMSGELERFTQLVGDIGASSETARSSLTEGLGELETQLSAKRAALTETEAELAKVTEASVRLLEIIQSGAQHSREDLPEAITTAANALGAVEQRAAALSGVMFATSQRGGELSEYLVKTNEEIEQTDNSITALQAKLAEQAEDTLAKLQGLRTRLSELTSEGETFAAATQEQLHDALSRLQSATQESFDALDTGARERVTALAEGISTEAVQALERSLRNDTAETIGALEQAASHASGVGREATIQLRDQLAKVNELTGNLEQRIARARELSEEQVNNDFARRMALITDSLNSASIDITGALSSEVSDTAWDAYLKGDRGIFTRRAVRLIDNGDARDIAELYQQDESFKANVTRYIHDFEAMLRSMLSTRNGNAMSVTVLGSDMGKLYVALAQSIERFRN